MDRQLYRANPCRASSVPYWKQQTFNLPAGWQVFHDSEAEKEALKAESEPFFRIKHDLKQLQQVKIPDNLVIRQLTPTDYPDLNEQMNLAYQGQGIHVTMESIEGWTKTPVYYPAGWLGLFQGENLVASIIIDYDVDLAEGIIEWFQVSPAYQGKGLGKLILNYGLEQIAQRASFVTVSGSQANPTNPEAVYRACGFTGDDVWWVYRKVNMLEKYLGKKVEVTAFNGVVFTGPVISHLPDYDSPDEVESILVSCSKGYIDFRPDEIKKIRILE